MKLRVFDRSIDTSTSAERALFGMIAGFAEFQRALIQERHVEAPRRYHAMLEWKARKT